MKGEKGAYHNIYKWGLSSDPSGEAIVVQNIHLTEHIQRCVLLNISEKRRGGEGRVERMRWGVIVYFLPSLPRQVHYNG